MAIVDVHFQHWRYTVPADLQSKYASPYYAKNKAGEALRKDALSSATRQAEVQLQLDRRLINCANEAYPESALSDPLADLELWDEWATGHRLFPYPGRFSRLGLIGQEQKISSSSSVGVLGEIFAGLFAQAGISPLVTVRVIRHWPDFIFHLQNRIYAFVEAKAFTKAEDSNELGKRVDAGALKEQLYDAVTQLNADPFLEIWVAFTGVVHVRPDPRFVVTFLQILPDANLRQQVGYKPLPAPLTKGLAQRAVALAGSKVGPELHGCFSRKITAKERKGAQKAMCSGDPAADRLRAEEEISRFAVSEVEELLGDAGEDVEKRSAVDQISADIRELLEGFVLAEDERGASFFGVKESAEEGVLTCLRPIANEFIFMANLSGDEVRRLSGRRPDSWSGAFEPIGEVEGHPVWLCGGAAFCQGPQELEGMSLRLGER